jgi:predicted aminopeptidase
MRSMIGVTLLVFLTGCQTATFYRQAVVGQWEIVTGRQSSGRLLKDPDTDGRLKSQLRLVQELCRFAEDELCLRGRGQYTRYTQLNRRYVVWNVFAAPEFSMEPKSWWYPVVGRLDYQGYFHERLALDYAKRLRCQGLDVHVGGVEAYSTLGWFNDPVLSTFVYLPEPGLADLLFHELAHQRVLISGDTDVNEAFATVAAREGVRRWLKREGTEEQLAEYLQEQRRDDEVVRLIQETRSRLEAVYAESDRMPPQDLRQQKAAILDDLPKAYAELKKPWAGYSGYDGWMAGDLNNAQLNAVDAYARWVPAMEMLLAGVGGELEEFYELLERLRRCEKSERHEILLWFEARSGKMGLRVD